MLMMLPLLCYLLLMVGSFFFWDSLVSTSCGSQPTSLVDRALVVHWWFVCLAAGLRWFLGGSVLIRLWFIVGSLVVHVRFMRGSRAVHGWFMAGSCVVHGWFMAGSWLVHGWFMAGS